MNEQNGLYGQIDLDKLWSMMQACPELVRTYQTKDGATHHAVRVNVGYRKQPSQSGDVAYIQIACKKDERKYDVGAYYVGDLKQSGQGGGGNMPPMAQNAPWGGAVTPAPMPMGAAQGMGANAQPMGAPVAQPQAPFPPQQAAAPQASPMPF